jgi:HPt (histidine-containing phosphotransfer) domain-containing protein
LDADQREYLEAVAKSADELMAIIDEILDFSNLEGGRLKIRSAPFALRASLDVRLAPIATNAREKGLDFCCRVDDAAPDALVGDGIRIAQVLTTLVGNAVKFTEAGHVRVSVTAEPVADDKTVLRFIVADTGVGIPEDKRATIFNPFEQADGSATRRFGGTGLGLATASQLVRLMGGRIELESAVGAGSTFHFAVPVQVNADASFAPLDDEARGEPAGTEGTGEPPSRNAPLDGSIIDIEAAAEHLGGDYSILGEIAGLCIEEHPKLLEAIRSALDAGDAVQVGSAAHTVKGMLANFSAARAVAAALALERIGKSGDLAEARPALAELEREIDRILPILHDLARSAAA